MKLLRFFAGLFFFVFAFAFFTACAERENNQNNQIEEHLSIMETMVSVGHVWPALALLRTGDNPLWFELAAEGPRLIESPAVASMIPYLPWPHARFITGIQVWENFVVMSVNRGGFLVFRTAENNLEAYMYRVSDSGYWDQYTAGSFFIWEDKPAVLLYRNEFFGESDAPPLRPQVFALDRYSSVPLPVSVPALENIPSEGFWEAEMIRRTADGIWYFRMRERGIGPGEIAYFRSGDLTGASERISFGQWRNSILPETPENTPPLLSLILEQAAALGVEGTPAARAVSADFDGQRFFSTAGSAAGTRLTEVFAYLREYPTPLAIVILADGRGFYSLGAQPRHFSLPLLPLEFVYTGIAVMGDVFIASWEEQQEAGIGAAGFMVLAAEWRR